MKRVEQVSIRPDAGVTNVSFFHHDPDRRDAQLDGLVLGCQEKLRAMGSEINCLAVSEGA